MQDAGYRTVVADHVSAKLIIATDVGRRASATSLSFKLTRVNSVVGNAPPVCVKNFAA